jgi:hypothetical protein
VESVREGDGLLGRKAGGEAIWLGGVANGQNGRQYRDGPDGQDYAPETISWMQASLMGESVRNSGARGPVIVLNEFVTLVTNGLFGED